MSLRLGRRTNAAGTNAKFPMFPHERLDTCMRFIVVIAQRALATSNRKTSAQGFKPVALLQQFGNFLDRNRPAHSYFSRFFLASFKAASGVASPLVAVSNAAFNELQTLPI